MLERIPTDGLAAALASTADKGTVARDGRGIGGASRVALTVETAVTLGVAGPAARRQGCCSLQAIRRRCGIQHQTVHGHGKHYDGLVVCQQPCPASLT